MGMCGFTCAHNNKNGYFCFDLICIFTVFSVQCALPCTAPCASHRQLHYASQHFQKVQTDENVHDLTKKNDELNIKRNIRFTHIKCRDHCNIIVSTSTIRLDDSCVIRNDYTSFTFFYCNDMQSKAQNYSDVDGYI